jgi:hypothetical protein
MTVAHGASREDLDYFGQRSIVERDGNEVLAIVIILKTLSNEAD